MSLTVTAELLGATTCPALENQRNWADNRDVDHEIDTAGLGEDALKDLQAAAVSVRDTKTARAIESILLARSGKFDKCVPNFKGFQGVLEAFLKSDMIDGWIYVTGADGKLYPQLVTEISYDSGYAYGRKQTPSVRLHTTSYGFYRDGNYQVQFGVFDATHTFSPQQVANRRIGDILAAEGLYKETPALRQAYMTSMARHRQIIQKAFAEQFRVEGAAYHYEDDDYARRGMPLAGRRVIHDLQEQDYGAAKPYAESMLFESDPDAAGVGAVPEHPVVRVFDLKTHEFYWVHADNMQPYAYDKSLRDKLILPASHRDLLDVLTSDLGAFVNDFIEGKSAGNVILCKGIPGVGKTLSAEVYAELIGRPLYAIHSGTLGTTAEQIEGSLQTVFQRAKRWGTVTLLDEADVYIVQRGQNIEQNAIVAEFLRTLEYFDGLLFMTTNRPDDIDDAIISRCAAIIEFSLPSAADAAAIWKVMATQFQAGLSAELIDQLVEHFPTISPRDIKMLLRLALRVAASKKETLQLETFRRCAMFRAIPMREAAAR